MNSNSSLDAKRNLPLDWLSIKTIYNQFLVGKSKLVKVDGLECIVYPVVWRNISVPTLRSMRDNECGNFCRRYGVFARRIKGLFR